MANNHNFELEDPKFVGEDYMFWNVMMRTFLIAKGLWDTIIEGYEESKDYINLVGEERSKKKEE